MKSYVVFLMPTGYCVNGEKTPWYLDLTWQVLINASTKKIAEKRARKLLAEDWDWTRSCPNNPDVVNIAVEEMTLKKAHAICDTYVPESRKGFLEHDWQCILLENARDFLYDNGIAR